MQISKSILCTAEVGSDVIAVAAENGIELDIAAFISIEYEDEAIIRSQVLPLAAEKINAVFTSKNAMRAVANALGGEQVNWRFFCFGNKTAKAVKTLLGADVECVTESSEELARFIIEYGVKQVCFFCGDLRMDTLPKALTEAGVYVEELIVYKTIETPRLCEKQYDGILFFSPSGVRSFFSANRVDEATALFAIGITTADEVKKNIDSEVTISNVQSKEGVVATAIKYFNNKTI